MRKIVLVLSLFVATSMGANAYVDNMYMTTEQYMMNTGYSKEMSNMMAVTNQDPYRKPATETKSSIWHRIYNYVAPGVNTNMDFYNHNINYEKPNWKDF